MIDEKYIAAVDLGSSKIALCVAKVSGDDVQIVYYKEHPSDGIRGSIVTNPMKASAPLKKAIAEAENELMIKILQVVVGLPRDGVIQQIADGKIERSNPDDYITREEVENLKSIAVEAYPLDDASNQVMYGAVAQSFSIDDQIHLVEDDTIGGLSSTLEGNFKVFIGSRKATNAIDKIFNNLGIAIAKKYFLPAVTAKAVLSEDDRQNGVALIDFGGGVTSVAIYHGGIMRHYAAIPFGGKTVTNDIRIESSISDSLAENLKLAYGACMPNKLASMSEKIIQIQYDDQPYKEIPVKYLSEVIDAREREIINAILYSIQGSGMQKLLRSGIVITGGGASMVNLKNLLKDMSGYNVRIGSARRLITAPGCMGANSPAATSVIGMILSAKEDNLPECISVPVRIEETPEPVIENVIEEEIEEAAPVTQMTDDEFIHGSTGTLDGFPDNEKKPKKIKKKATIEKNGLKLFWSKITQTVGNVYDSVTDDNL